LILPRTRSVPIKSEEQQALLSLQRTRSGFVEERISRTAVLHPICMLSSQDSV
jgi:transposase